MNSTDLPALVRTQDGGVIARPDHWTFFFGDLRFPLPRMFIGRCNIGPPKRNNAAIIVGVKLSNMNARIPAGASCVSARRAQFSLNRSTARREGERKEKKKITDVQTSPSNDERPKKSGREDGAETVNSVGRA